MISQDVLCVRLGLIVAQVCSGGALSSYMPNAHITVMVPWQVNADDVGASSAAYVHHANVRCGVRASACLLVSAYDSVPAVRGQRSRFRSHDLDSTYIVGHVLGSFNGFVSLYSELGHKARARNIWVVCSLKPQHPTAVFIGEPVRVR